MRGIELRPPNKPDQTERYHNLDPYALSAQDFSGPMMSTYNESTTSEMYVAFIGYYQTGSSMAHTHHRKSKCSKVIREIEK
jgi:hypothetical protein